MDTSTQVTNIVRSQAFTAAKRQRRTREEKRRLVDETLVEGASVARVARAHGVNANQVFGGRKLTGGVRNAPGTRNYPCNGEMLLHNFFARRRW